MIATTLFAILVFGALRVALKASRDRRELAVARSRHLRAGRDPA